QLLPTSCVCLPSRHAALPIFARAKIDIGVYGMNLAVEPGIDNHYVVDPDTHAVIGRGRKPVGTCRQIRGLCPLCGKVIGENLGGDRKSTRLNSSHVKISYAVF